MRQDAVRSPPGGENNLVVLLRVEREEDQVTTWYAPRVGNGKTQDAGIEFRQPRGILTEKTDV